MDLATIIGLVIGITLLLVAVLLGGSLMLFINIPSLLLVVGGTFAATMIRNPLNELVSVIQIVKKTFTHKLEAPADLISQVVDMSRKARKESLLSLEKVKIEDAFLAKGVNLCVDGLEPAQIRGILETDIGATTKRHKRGQSVVENLGGAAPAFGMIGTLIGLVQMLANMSDPKSIGPAMAVAILTTLYGAIIQNLFANPLVDKLKMRSEQEIANMVVCLEGVLGIVQGEHPASIEERLKAFLPPKLRDTEKKEKAAA